MPRDHPRAPVVAAYLRARKARWLFAAMGVIGLVIAVWGSREVTAPAVTETGASTVQFWRLFAVASATLPVLTLASPMSELEAAGGPAYHRLRSLVLAAAFLISSGSFLLPAWLSVGPSALPLIVRSLLAWFGLALLGGRTLGWRASWILPWAAMSALIFWGYDSRAGDYRWWEFTAQPIWHLPSALLALGLFAAGLTAYAMTPWRIRRLLRRRASAAVNGGVPTRPGRPACDSAAPPG